MKPHKEAIALIIKNTKGEFLAVKRPDNPADDIAGVWGLPAVTRHENESENEAALRVGQQKFGVVIMLGAKIGESTHERPTYELHLVDYEATIVSGHPAVPQGDKSVTQYAKCKFTNDPTILITAAKKGSQCTQIFLESLGIDWNSTSS